MTKKVTNAIEAGEAEVVRKPPKRVAKKPAKRRAAAPAPKAPPKPRPMSAAEIAKLKTVGDAYTETGYIETLSPLRTPNGQKQTEITINQHVYKFMKNADGHFVTHVPYADDFAAILSIGAGYQRYGKTRKPIAAPPRGATLMPTIDEEPLEVQPSQMVPERATRSLAIDPAAG